MKLFYLIVILATVVNAQRYVRDIGLHLKGHHDEHHHHHHDEQSPSQSQQASARTSPGYGRNIPNPPLTIGLTPADQPVVPERTSPPQTSGYPKENPPNPLKIGPPEQETRNVEVKVDQKERNRQLNEDDSSANQMGGEIPGEAGKDYPIYNTVPETSFKCEDQQWPGYYADEEARCQVFHICHDSRKSSFLCPNGTLFQQKVFVCDWWFNVNCSASKDFFNLNALIGVAPPKKEPAPAGPPPATPSLVSSPSEIAAVELDQNQPNLEYLPPPPVQQQENPPPPPAEYLPPPPSPASQPSPPVSASNADNQPPPQNYLPPENPPASQYLPPPVISATTAEVVAPLPTEYLPPLSQMPPTAAEAIANGILSTKPCDHAVESVPNLNYLPPSL